MQSEQKTPDEVEVDRLLGDKALVSLDEVTRLGGPSRGTLQRAAAGGQIKLVKNGSSSDLTRATAKMILLKGLGPIPFLYGKQGAVQQAKLTPGAAAKEAPAINRAEGRKRA